MTKNSIKKKTLNPFSTSVLFIFVMVVFSITANVYVEKDVVATQTERLEILSLVFLEGRKVELITENSGTVALTVDEVWINDERQTFTTNATSNTIPPQKLMIISAVYPYYNGSNYQIKIVSEKGNNYFCTAIALNVLSPSPDNLKLQ